MVPKYQNVIIICLEKCDPMLRCHLCERGKNQNSHQKNWIPPNDELWNNLFSRIQLGRLSISSTLLHLYCCLLQNRSDSSTTGTNTIHNYFRYAYGSANLTTTPEFKICLKCRHWMNEWMNEVMYIMAINNIMSVNLPQVQWRHLFLAQTLDLITFCKEAMCGDLFTLD